MYLSIYGLFYPIPNAFVMTRLFNNCIHKEVETLTLPVSVPLYGGRLIQN